MKLPKSEHRDRGYLTHAQVAAVDRHSEAIRFLAYTGLRWGEMAALRVQDFDMLRRRVNVSRSVTECGKLVWGTPKPGERRSVRELRDAGFELALSFEDDRRNVAMFRDEGVPSVYIHSGYYD